MTAGGPNQIQTVDLSALADRSGVVRLDQLAALTASSDVVVGEVLDEKLVLWRGLAGWPEEPDPHWAPYLWPLAPPLRSVSIRTVERLDVAQDTIEHPEDVPDEFACDPLLDGVLRAFRHAVCGSWTTTAVPRRRTSHTGPARPPSTSWPAVPDAEGMTERETALSGGTGARR